MSVESTNIPASEALQRLRDGNQRYHQNVHNVDSMQRLGRGDVGAFD